MWTPICISDKPKPPEWIGVYAKSGYNVKNPSEMKDIALQLTRRFITGLVRALDREMLPIVSFFPLFKVYNLVRRNSTKYKWVIPP